MTFTHMASSVPKPHHERQDLCTNRPAYRNGRQLKAVKVYTVSQESRYLLVQGIPALGLHTELIKEFALYGAVEEYRLLDDYPAEEFTEVMWVKYVKIHSARLAKRKMDDYEYCGGKLHICYAPEYESVDDVRAKLQDRRQSVARRLRQLAAETGERGERKTDSGSKMLPLADEEPMTLEENPTASVTTRTSVSQPPPAFPLPPLNQPPPPLSLPPPPAPPLGLLPHDPALAFGYPSLPPPPVEIVRYESRDMLFQHPPHLRSVSGPFRFPSSATRPRFHANNLHHVPRSHFPAQRQPFSTPCSATLSHPVDPLLVVETRNEVHPPGDSPSSASDFQQRDKTGKARPDGASKAAANGRRPIEPVIKEYKSSGTAPRFVPRQISKKPATVAVSNRSVDPVIEELKRNALVLGAKTQGPTLPPAEEQKRKTFGLSETGSTSLDGTVKAIREKVAQFSDSAPSTKKHKES